MKKQIKNNKMLFEIYCGPYKTALVLNKIIGITMTENGGCRVFLENDETGMLTTESYNSLFVRLDNVLECQKENKNDKISNS